MRETGAVQGVLAGELGEPGREERLVIVHTTIVELVLVSLHAIAIVAIVVLLVLQGRYRFAQTRLDRRDV
jgi:hypothetical protein